MRHSRVVVVGVEQVGEFARVDVGGVGEEVADVLHRRVEHGRVRVDLGAVARGEQHGLGEVLGLGQRLECLGECIGRDRDQIFPSRLPASALRGTEAEALRE